MSYKGLIVGGHLAGQWRSHNLPRFTDTRPAGGTIEMADGNTLYWDGFTATETYVHDAAEPYGEFWVPEGKDAAWAIAELVRCYRAEHFAEASE